MRRPLNILWLYVCETQHWPQRPEVLAPKISIKKAVSLEKRSSENFYSSWHWEQHVYSLDIFPTLSEVLPSCSVDPTVTRQISHLQSKALEDGTSEATSRIEKKHYSLWQAGTHQPLIKNRHLLHQSCLREALLPEVCESHQDQVTRARPGHPALPRALLERVQFHLLRKRRRAVTGRAV